MVIALQYALHIVNPLNVTELFFLGWLSSCHTNFISIFKKSSIALKFYECDQNNKGTISCEMKMGNAKNRCYYIKRTITQL